MTMDSKEVASKFLEAFKALHDESEKLFGFGRGDTEAKFAEIRYQEHVDGLQRLINGEDITFEAGYDIVFSDILDSFSHNPFGVAYIDEPSPDQKKLFEDRDTFKDKIETFKIDKETGVLSLVEGGVIPKSEVTQNLHYSTMMQEKRNSHEALNYTNMAESILETIETPFGDKQVFEAVLPKDNIQRQSFSEIMEELGIVSPFTNHPDSELHSAPMNPNYTRYVNKLESLSVLEAINEGGVSEMDLTQRLQKYLANESANPEKWKFSVNHSNYDKIEPENEVDNAIKQNLKIVANMSEEQYSMAVEKVGNTAIGKKLWLPETKQEFMEQQVKNIVANGTELDMAEIGKSPTLLEASKEALKQASQKPLSALGTLASYINEKLTTQTADVSR